MLSAFSNQTDIVIGTPVSNRHYNGVENLIGFFVNTLALRVQIDKNMNLKDFIKSIGNKLKKLNLIKIYHLKN